MSSVMTIAFIAISFAVAFTLSVITTPRAEL